MSKRLKLWYLARRILKKSTYYSCLSKSHYTDTWVKFGYRGWLVSDGAKGQDCYGDKDTFYSWIYVNCLKKMYYLTTRNLLCFLCTENKSWTLDFSANLAEKDDNFWTLVLRVYIRFIFNRQNAVSACKILKKTNKTTWNVNKHCRAAFVW